MFFDPTVGSFPVKLISAATTNLTSIKAAPGKLVGMYVSNTNAAIRYIKFYNSLFNSITVGTTIPYLTIAVPLTGVANLSQPLGILFPVGMAFATTTLPADSDATAVGAGDLIINIFAI